jgi:hypothetical protein
MTEYNGDDPLVAWIDCYDVKPKKRILKDVAKAEVQRAWRDWDGDKSAAHAKPMFYSWLCRNRPYFLTYRKSGDRWQDILSWILQWENRAAARTKSREKRDE